MVSGGTADQPQQYIGMLAMTERRQRWCMALVHTPEAMRRQGIGKGMWASALTYLKPGNMVSVSGSGVSGYLGKRLLDEARLYALSRYGLEDGA